MWLRALLVQCAWAAGRSKGTYLQAMFRRLAASRHPEAGRAYSRAWQRWLGGRVGGAGAEGEYSRALEAGPGPARSPVNCGFTLLYRAVWERAEAVAGPAAFVLDDEGERSLGPRWDAAAAALLDAAMASGRRPS